MLASLVIAGIAWIQLTYAKPVEVSMKAPWYPVSESILALETMSEYNASSFFPLLSLLINERLKGISDLNETEFILNSAERTSFLRPEALPALREEIQLGTVIPRIQAQYQMFDTMSGQELTKNNNVTACPVVMWTENEYTCDSTVLYALQAPENPEIPSLRADDRVIGNGDQWLVVYADLDSPEFPEWHEVLLEMALNGRASYVLRHRPSISLAPLGREMKLAGYGVQFDLKKTDYLVIDDRINDGEEVVLDRTSTKQISTTEIPQIGHALARKIRSLNASDEEKFTMLQDLVFNLPAHLHNITKENNDAQNDGNVTGSSLGVSGFNAAFLDGILLRDNDLFDFYKTLHEEMSLLSNLNIQTPDDLDVPAFLSSGVAHGGDDDGTARKIRYDLTKSRSAIGWINDIEEDPLYSQLSSDLELLKSSSSPFVPLRRNMHSVVIAGNFSDRAMLAALYDITQQVGQYLPLQIGIVAPNKEWLSIAKLGTDARQAFITKILSGAPLVAAAKYAGEIYEEMINDPEQAKLVKQSRPLGDPTKFYERFGVDVSKSPVLFLNGFPLPTDDWMRLATHIFQKDSDYIRQLEDMEEVGSFRDVLLKTGEAKRNHLLDPITVDYKSWPLYSPLAVFRNPDNTTDETLVKHSVLLSSSFGSIKPFLLAEAILERARDKNDIELVVRPLNGIDPRFYKSIMDPTYSMFRFSTDLFAAARGHLFQRKTEPRVFNVSQAPEVNATDLPKESDAISIDGRHIDLSEIDLTTKLLPEVIELETNRVRRIREAVPEIAGVGIAALTEASLDRTTISQDDIPDIFINSNTTNVTLSILVDPATTEGQQYLGLGVAAANAGLKVKIFLTPSDVEEVPKSFYQPVLKRSEPAKFDKLDDDTLYTAKVVEPVAWVTVASDSDYDLDNVLLNMVKEESMPVEYNLRGLLIQGFASGRDAAGAALELNTANGTKISDTAVMANLGYFQFQVPIPGIYEVCVAENPLSFATAKGSSDCLAAPVSGYEGLSLRTFIQKGSAQIKKRKEKAKGSLWKSLTGGSSDSPKKDSIPAEVNIFTIASGHLYERFASIMMLSVIKHTKHSVKFWLVDNFSSPKFRKFVPEFAKEHGFEFEFVSYKWPSWLRRQSEKQREIWGYKMLFLDTLFPKSLSDVIFVDSDQIVRTDFKELLEMDLGEAPYAMAPMGDDREETEPFRFWKQGFWKELLYDKGLQYHISALYRVNLKKFRENHIGDILRQQYQRLSSNPENLANLDQDLPNSLQEIIPIYTLPQQWLWCETWCSDESLQTAKTIDLCNNPLTKEPKLERAKRQTPEWSQYDDVVSQFSDEVARKLALAKKEAPARLSQQEIQKSLKYYRKERPQKPQNSDHPNDHDFSEDNDDLEHEEL